MRIVTKFKIFSLALVVAAVAPSVQAQQETGKGWSLGAAALISNSPYKGDDNKVWPVPMLGYEGDNFYLRGPMAGYYLWNDDTDKLSVVAYYSPLHFRPKDSDNHRMKRLDYRKSTGMAGLSYAHYTEYGFLRTILAGDFLDESNGITWDLAWLYRYQSGAWSVTPGIGALWNSENQNKYYYGVSRKESRRSGIDHYNPDSNWNPYVELSVNYKLSDSWDIYGMGRYTRLTGEIKDSPMVDKSWNGVLMTGVTYHF
ncbi:outer membrane protein [Salmonella enterica subsp. enterica serovar Choleraesuis]|nr:outer membrane protein [Salmonella enterica subsp. enterica serovar Choleraesuis]